MGRGGAILANQIKKKLKHEFLEIHKIFINFN